jgi:hypothetical protein
VRINSAEQKSEKKNKEKEDKRNQLVNFHLKLPIFNTKELGSLSTI